MRSERRGIEVGQGLPALGPFYFSGFPAADLEVVRRLGQRSEVMRP